MNSAEPHTRKPFGRARSGMLIIITSLTITLAGAKTYSAVSPGPGRTLTAAAVQTAAGPHIQTDRAEYTVGATVMVSGSGWQPGEAVNVYLTPTPITEENRLTGREHKLTAAADAGGAFSASGTLDFGERMLAVTAFGQTSGRRAVTRARITLSSDIRTESVTGSPQPGTRPEGVGLEAGLSVTPQSAQNLVKKILGAGVTVSNVSFTGTANSAATFLGGSGIIGFEDGIVLSTGAAANVIGPNVSSGITEVLGTSGDVGCRSRTTLSSARPMCATKAGG